nr:glutathione S-transferase GSTZ [Beauveria bassiana]
MRKPDTAMMAGESYCLHTFFSSSSCQRIRIAAHLKSIPLTMLYLDLRDDTKHISNDSSRSAAHVPTLIVTHSDGTSTAIRQAVDILEYFEERFPDTCPLLPSSASQSSRARALVRDFVNIIAVDVVEQQQQFPAGGSSNAVSNRASVTGHGFEEQHQRATVAFRRVLASYQQLLESARGADAKTCLYTVGDAITLADVCLVPAMEQAVAYGVDMAGLQHVARIYNHLKKLPAFTDFDWRKHATANRRL